MAIDKKAGKLSFILLIIAFIVPVIMAKIALENDWFNKASTNRGQLLDPIIEAQDLLQGAETKWHFLYVIPAMCDAACDNAIYSINQVKTAIGRESDRVNAVFIATETSDQSALTKIAEISATQVLQQQKENVNKVFKDESVNAIFIADTLNNIVLKYPNTPDEEQAIMDSRDMLADIKKLLKLSRIG
ncbi:hypothetical protein KJ365_11210 [Glaciecola sp. XM2]|jgi:hypothetical protein|uniref:hypothetical protein n=1 Tax=Glaciecola sp. XM2 TaxID=1914931 RepID=UPI001BDF3AFD|nr:hypothetical protein [Glaciecola sp. XM2]MBT1451447.1 hypothetical protein [Glaciecola sp. XM2]